MNKETILSTAYLAPIQYYTKLLIYDKVYVEMHENFIKQTYRNRCKIYAANGELSLSIPIKKDRVKVKTKDIIVDYDTNWRKMHWKSIESAYKSSPFFEFYQDDFAPLYEKKYKYLIDLNNELQNIILSHLDIQVHFIPTDDYLKKDEVLIDDYRESIHPKNDFADKKFRVEHYIQVFQEKHGFIPNLSIIDLLFNEGPNATDLLEKSIQKD